MDNSKYLKPYYDAMRNGESVTKQPLELENTCFFEHHEQAKLLVYNGLGYMPPYWFYTPLIAFLRTYIEQRRLNQISDNDFVQGITVVIKQIRNQQMQKENRLREFEGEDFEYYFRTAKENKHKTRKILFDMLGFETKNIHSLEAEMILRENYFSDAKAELDDFQPLAYYAATIALYRYNYMEYSEAAANDTPLLGLIIPRKRNLPEV